MHFSVSFHPHQLSYHELNAEALFHFFPASLLCFPASKKEDDSITSQSIVTNLPHAYSLYYVTIKRKKKKSTEWLVSSLTSVPVVILFPSSALNSKLKWTGMGEFNSDDLYIYYCGQESLRRNGVAIMVNKRVWNAVLGCNLKNDRMISVHFQGKQFNITVIQTYAPTTNAEEAEAEWFYEDLQDLFRTKTPKRCPFHFRGQEWKSRKSRYTWSNRQIWLRVWNEAGQRLIEVFVCLFVF